MGLRVLADRVIVEPQEEQRSKGGVVLPDVSQEKPQRGKVVGIGSEAKDIELHDVVLFSKYGGTEVEHEGTKLIVLKSADVLAVVE